ncbi:MAG TPA: hypothetical protein VK553_11435 [Candidatus Nitrosopolaris rasttigaisensis]|nr:hypothetical protein [Candidatus Nitrosopolaris rasttigaisensis]
MIVSTKKPASIYSFQGNLIAGGGSYLPFGRMIWNLKNNQKWTTKYRIGEDVVTNWHFYSTEIWSPSKSDCFREWPYFAPNIYIKIDDNSTFDASNYFDTSLIVAIDENTYSNINVDDLTVILNSIYELSNCVRLAKTIRPWGIGWSDSSFSEGIQDENANRYLKSKVDFTMTDKYKWEIIKEV